MAAGAEAAAIRETVTLTQRVPGASRLRQSGVSSNRFGLSVGSGRPAGRFTQASRHQSVRLRISWLRPLLKQRSHGGAGHHDRTVQRRRWKDNPRHSARRLLGALRCTGCGARIDPQGTFSAWVALRRARLGEKAIGFDFAALPGWRAPRWVDDRVGAMDLVLIDAPPHAE